MANIVLGVSGSIAAYRAADLARDLMRLGHTVRVCLTDSAAKFVTPALFEALTGQPCLTDTFEEPVTGRMAHIDWARQADLIIIAPATANTLARLAHGESEDMLTTIALAYDGLTLVAPAMNPTMWSNDANQRNLTTLRDRGIWIIEPADGDVACGENGQGKLASNPEILAQAQLALTQRRALAGKQVLITSGATQEPIDDVRFLSNRSTGKMGAALALAALAMGAEVTVITGPGHVTLPARAHQIRITTAEQMLAAALPLAPAADLIIGVAAVADYRPAHPVKGKLRRGNTQLSLELIPNPDVIATLAKNAKPGAFVLAFAAEPDESLAVAAEKRRRKGVHAIAVNNVSDAAIGFGSDLNEITLVTESPENHSGRHSKLAVAYWLLQKIAVH